MSRSLHFSQNGLGDLFTGFGVHWNVGKLALSINIVVDSDIDWPSFALAVMHESTKMVEAITHVTAVNGFIFPPDSFFSLFAGICLVFDILWTSFATEHFDCLTPSLSLGHISSSFIRLDISFH